MNSSNREATIVEFPAKKIQIVSQAIKQLKPLLEVISDAVHLDPTKDTAPGREIEMLVLGALADVFISKFGTMNNATQGKGSVCNRGTMRKRINKFREYFND